MPYFQYKAKDKAGEIISGKLEAESRNAAVSRLQVMGYFPLVLEAEEREKAEPGARAKWAGLGRPRGARIKTRDLTQFYRQMADLVGAGIPLVKALSIVQSQTLNPRLRSILGQINQDVQAGDTFSRSLEKHPAIFSKLTISMIKAGEAGGLLEDSLTRLADFAENEQELRGRIASALAYPAIMIVAGGLAVFAIFTFVIPRIVGIFEELNQALPLMTVVLIAASDFMRNYWFLVLLGIAALALGLRRWVATERGRYQFDQGLLKIPVVGELLLKRDVARFTRTLGALLRNGVPILDALEIASQVLTNSVIRRDLEGVPESVTQGGGMAPSLRESKLFPPVVTNMVAIGEETGNLPDVLTKVATSYESEVDRQMKALTSIIEPVIILVLGVVVAFIVIAMLLPIFELDPTAG